MATPVATSVITTVFRRSGWYIALGGRKIPCAKPVVEVTSRQRTTRDREICFLHPKPKENNSTNQQSFYRVVNEKEGMFHIKINILGSNLK